MLTDEDEFLHTIAILIIPVGTQLCIIRHELHQFLFGHGSEPLAGFAQIELPSSLLKEVTHIILFGKIAHAFAPNDILRPMRGHEVIEESQIERTAGIVDVSLDAKLRQMVMFFVIVVVMIVIVVIVMMFVLMVMVGVFHFLDPGCRSGRFVKIEQACMQQFVEFHITIVRFDDLRGWLNRFHDCFDTR